MEDEQRKTEADRWHVRASAAEGALSSIRDVLAREGHDGTCRHRIEQIVADYDRRLTAPAEAAEEER